MYMQRKHIHVCVYREREREKEREKGCTLLFSFLKLYGFTTICKPMPY